MKIDITNFVAHQISSQHKSFIDWITAYLDNANSSPERENLVDYFSFEGATYHNPQDLQSGDYSWKYRIEVTGKDGAEDTRSIEFSLLFSEGYLNDSPGIFASYEWINNAVKERLKACGLDVSKQTIKNLRSVICAHIMHLQHIKAQIRFIEEGQSHTKKISVPDFQIERFEYIYTTPF